VKKIKNAILGLFSKIVSAVCMFVVSMAAGSISIFGPYEPEMPNCLIPKSGE